MEQPKYKLYKHTFPNGKVYIGITRQTLARRFNNGRGYKDCPKMYNAVLKYGWNNVEHEILYDGLTKDEAEKKEIETIAFYNSVKNGYNTDHGGNVCGTHSIETRAKISAANRGKTKRKWTDEEKQKLSIIHMGAKNGFFQKHHTEETKRRQSDRMKGNQYNKGNHHTEQFKVWKSEQMREYYANNENSRSRKVIKICGDGNEIIFQSLRAAARATGVSPAGLYSHIKNGAEFYGAIWRYQNERET